MKIKYGFSTSTKNIRGDYNFKWTGELNSITMVAKKRLLVNIPRKNTSVVNIPRKTFKALGGPEILPTEVNGRLQEEQA